MLSIRKEKTRRGDTGNMLYSNWLHNFYGHEKKCARTTNSPRLKIAKITRRFDHDGSAGKLVPANLKGTTDCQNDSWTRDPSLFYHC